MTENIKSTCYVVVSYPKKANPMMINSKRFYIHSKKTNNLTEMREYFRRIKELKKSEENFVHLVSYDRAIEMRQKWRDKYEPMEKPTVALEDLDCRLNNLYNNRAFYI